VSRILVTGGAGFLGRPTVTFLRAKGHDVTVVRSREYDLRDARNIERVLTDARPEVVVHLAAAVGGIGANAAEPARFFYDNALMGIQLMHAAYSRGVRKFVTVGTVCEYPEFAQAPFGEDQLWHGYPAPVTAPYALSKKMLLVQAQAYRQQYGFDSIHLIPTNLYGPGDNFDVESGHVVPGLIAKFSAAREHGASLVRCWGSGTATREFIYINDAAWAIALATERYSGAEPVNIGTGVETPVRELAERIGELYGFGPEALVWDTDRPDGTPRRQLDVSRARDAFGFEAVVDLAAGLKLTSEWYEAQR